jgi:integrase/recombinase XerD
MLDSGRAPATCIARQRGVRRFSFWLAAKGIIERDAIDGVRAPKVDEPVVPALTDQQLRSLLATRAGSGFHDVRDRALSGSWPRPPRAPRRRLAWSCRTSILTPTSRSSAGQGRQGAARAVQPAVRRDVRDYLRIRRRPRRAKAGSLALWLGEAGRQFGYAGLYNSIARRGEAAGLGPDVHPHVLRHTGAVRWLDKSGSTTGLMAVAA